MTLKLTNFSLKASNQAISKVKANLKVFTAEDNEGLFINKQFVINTSENEWEHDKTERKKTQLPYLR